MKPKYSSNANCCKIGCKVDSTIERCQNYTNVIEERDSKSLHADDCDDENNNSYRNQEFQMVTSKETSIHGVKNSLENVVVETNKLHSRCKASTQNQALLRKINTTSHHQQSNSYQNNVIKTTKTYPLKTNQHQEQHRRSNQKDAVKTIKESSSRRSSPLGKRTLLPTPRRILLNPAPDIKPLMPELQNSTFTSSSMLLIRAIKLGIKQSKLHTKT